MSSLLLTSSAFKQHQILEPCAFLQLTVRVSENVITIIISFKHTQPLRHTDQTIFITQSLIAPADMLHLIFGTNFLHHSEFLFELLIPLSVTFI